MECSGLDGFSEAACDHAIKPRNYGHLMDYNSHARITGPCGDTMEFWLAIEEGAVKAISFVTDGCGSSKACGSMTACLAEGREIQDVLNLQQGDVLNALGTIPAEYEHCALLAVTTLKKACDNYLRRHSETPSEGSGNQSPCNSCSEQNCDAAHRQKDETEEQFRERQELQSRLCRIGNKIVVLSGKGGVGKSTVAVNLAAALVLSGKRVGLLDVDIHGPSIPIMLNLGREMIQGSEEGLLPIMVGGLKVMSIGFLLRSSDDAIIWRGPLKMGVIKQFLKDVVWGDLDYLIVDSPPGTGDEPLSVCQLIGAVNGAVIVTTPQKVAAIDVRKCITFCRQLKVPVLGVVENMRGFACPKCGAVTQILPAGAGQAISADMHVPLLGSIPFDPEIAEACDNGRAFIQHYAATHTAAIMRNIIQEIINRNEQHIGGGNAPKPTRKESNS